MERNVLNLFLQKVSQGDASYLDRLCKRLADRLIYVPLIEENSGGSKTSTTLKVFHLEKNGCTVVPAFSSERKFQAWRKNQKDNFSCEALLGADLCLALGNSAGLLVDPSSDYEVLLEPESVVSIAETPVQEFLKQAV